MRKGQAGAGVSSAPGSSSRTGGGATGRKAVRVQWPSFGTGLRYTKYFLCCAFYLFFFFFSCLYIIRHPVLCSVTKLTSTTSRILRRPILDVRPENDALAQKAKSSQKQNENAGPDVAAVKSEKESPQEPAPATVILRAVTPVPIPTLAIPPPIAPAVSPAPALASVAVAAPSKVDPADVIVIDDDDEGMEAQLGGVVMTGGVTIPSVERESEDRDEDAACKVVVENLDKDRDDVPIVVTSGVPTVAVGLPVRTKYEKSVEAPGGAAVDRVMNDAEGKSKDTSTRDVATAMVNQETPLRLEFNGVIGE